MPRKKQGGKDVKSTNVIDISAKRKNTTKKDKIDTTEIVDTQGSKKEKKSTLAVGSIDKPGKQTDPNPSILPDDVNQEKPFKRRRSGPICGAKGKRRNAPCCNPAGWRTDHPGTGRCYLHGGRSPGAPKGNKRALKTGEFETVFYDALTEEEQTLWHSMVMDKRYQILEEVRLWTMRERRMMERIKVLMEAQQEMIHVEETEEEGFNDNGPYNKTTVKSQGKLTQILALEEALTRVQANKAKAIELLHNIGENDEGEDEKLDALMEMLNNARAEYLKQYGNTEGAGADGAAIQGAEEDED